MIAIAARAGDAPGCDLRLEHQLRKLAKDIDVRREARTDADVLLVVIGPKWAEPPLDAQSVEAIARTHGAGRTIIPVLVQGGIMPAAKTLPANIRPLARIHAATLHNDGFDAGVGKLSRNHIRGGDGGGPWADGDASGRIRISSVNPGLLIRAVSVIDSIQPITVRIDGAIHGSLHLFGDELTVPVPRRPSRGAAPQSVGGSGAGGRAGTTRRWSSA